MFEKTLSDLIRGLRANKKNEAKYIATCMSEIRDELAKPSDVDVKAQAVLKLCYLHMLGHDMAWASFQVLQTISLPRFANKRIGYLAASLSFAPESDVMMLSTNTFKKDLSSNQYLDASVALSCLADIATPELVQSLLPDLSAMLTHSKPYIRRKVLLLMFRVLEQCPDAMTVVHQRLTDRLEDDRAVVTAAVTVICELARAYPRQFLELAPQLFGLLTSSTNNWMLIKLIKMLVSLTPSEPRLSKKLIQPLIQLMESTQSMSLLYECISAVVNGGLLLPDINPNAERLAKLCVTKLRTFLESQDPNLRYVALTALSRLVDTHAYLVMQDQELVFACVNSGDLTIRMRALSILTKLASSANLQTIVDYLVSQIRDETRSDNAVVEAQPADNTNNNVLNSNPRYLSGVLDCILQLCTQDQYALIRDFEWLVDTLCVLAKIKGAVDGERLATILVDLAVRIRDLRPYCIEAMLGLLRQDDLWTLPTFQGTLPVFRAVAWILGEYCSQLGQEQAALAETFLGERAQQLPPELQALGLQAALKITVHWTCDVLRQQQDSFEAPRETELKDTIAALTERLNQAWCRSSDLEVSSRANLMRHLLVLLPTHAEPDSDNALLQDIYMSILGSELNPVAANAQGLVPPPSDHVLDQWLSDEAQAWWTAGDTPDLLDADDFAQRKAGSKTKKKTKKRATKEADDANAPGSDSDEAETIQRQRMERMERLKGDPFYIKSERPSPPTSPARNVASPHEGMSHAGQSGKPLVSKRPLQHVPRAYSVLTVNEVPAESASSSKTATSPVAQQTSKLRQLRVDDVVVDRQKAVKAQRKERTVPSKSRATRFGYAVEWEDERVSLNVFFASPVPSKTAILSLPVTVSICNKSRTRSMCDLAFSISHLPKKVKATGLADDGHLFASDCNVEAGADTKKLFMVKLALVNAPQLMMTSFKCNLTYTVKEASFRKQLECPLLPSYFCLNVPAPSPDAFVAALTAADAPFEHQQEITLTCDDLTALLRGYHYSATAQSSITIDAMSRLLRLQLVEQTGEAASLWGEVQVPSDSVAGKGDDNNDAQHQSLKIAGMIKVRDNSEAHVAFKSSEAWIVEAFVRMLRP
ncbi:AP-3 complex subunit delta [Sorochytrium milnesiophthora]